MPGKATPSQARPIQLRKTVRGEIGMKPNAKTETSPCRSSKNHGRVEWPKCLGNSHEMPPANPHLSGNRSGKIGRDDESRRRSPTVPGDKADPTTANHHPPLNHLFDRFGRLGIEMQLGAGNSEWIASLYLISDELLLAPGPEPSEKRRPEKPPNHESERSWTS